MLYTSVSLRIFGLTVILFTFWGCTRQPPPSPIVQKVQDSGAGDLSNLSQLNIQEWLLKHKDLAYQVDAACKPVQEKATAAWQETTEGKVCGAAHQIALARPVPVQGDSVGYWPGK